MGSWGVLDKPQHLDMGFQRMSHVELEMLTDRLLNPPKTGGRSRQDQPSTSHKSRAATTSDRTRFTGIDRYRDEEDREYYEEGGASDDNQGTFGDSGERERGHEGSRRRGGGAGDGDGTESVYDRLSRPATRSKSGITRFSRSSSEIESRGGVRHQYYDEHQQPGGRRHSPYKGTKPMTAEELNMSINRLASSVYSTRGGGARTTSGYDPTRFDGNYDDDTTSRIMPLGQQTLSPERISEIVLRLTTPRGAITCQTRQSLPSIRRVNTKPMSALQLSALTERLNKCDKSVDAQRVYGPSQKRFGIVNSFLWKGWN